MRTHEPLFDVWGDASSHGRRALGHLGQRCVHSRISFDLRSDEGVRRYRAFLDEAADLVVSYGGSLSGEHGDGQQRAELLQKQYGIAPFTSTCTSSRASDPSYRTWTLSPAACTPVVMVGRSSPSRVWVGRWGV